MAYYAGKNGPQGAGGGAPASSRSPCARRALDIGIGDDGVTRHSPPTPPGHAGPHPAVRKVEVTRRASVPQARRGDNGDNVIMDNGVDNGDILLFFSHYALCVASASSGSRSLNFPFFASLKSMRCSSAKTVSSSA